MLTNLNIFLSQNHNLFKNTYLINIINSINNLAFKAPVSPNDSLRKWNTMSQHNRNVTWAVTTPVGYEGVNNKIINIGN